VNNLKRIPNISGEIVDLIPYCSDYDEDIIRIRNLKDSKYYLSQNNNLEIKDQKKWAAEYFFKENDYYWIIICKETKQFIGTTSLYELKNNIIEKGRLVVDPEVSLRKPYVLESEILILDFAFKKLNVEKVITYNKEDNLKMQSINKRFGFEKTHSVNINGNNYFGFLLNKENVTYTKLKKVIKMWSREKK